MIAPFYRAGRRSRSACVDHKPRTLRVEPLEQRCMLSAGHGGDLPTIAEGDSQTVIGPHHALVGHPGSPDTHFFAETGDEHHFAWQDQDQDPSTPDVIDIFYDFRDIPGRWGENLITPGQIAMAELALDKWEVASSGKIQFIRDTGALRSDIINIGTGNLRALGKFRSGPGGILGLGGGTYTHNSDDHTITGGVAWMDSGDAWDEVNGNGDIDGEFDYFTVVAQEIGHALGLGHDSSGTHIMNGRYTGEVADYSTADAGHIQAAYEVSGPVNAAPAVSITSPGDGELFANGASGASEASISFVGTADDSEDGDLTGSITWTSGGNIIGTGGAFSATLANDMNHTITATVTDLGGSTTSESITITVGTPTVATSVLVNSVTYVTQGGKNKDRNLSVTVGLVDDLGIMVSGASVSITLSNDTSGGPWLGTGTTGAEGIVTWTLKNAPVGTYTTVVTAVSADSLTWNGSTPTNEITKSSSSGKPAVGEMLFAGASVSSSIGLSSELLIVESDGRFGGTEVFSGRQEHSSTDDAPVRRRATARRAARPAFSRAAVDVSMEAMAESRSALRHRTASRRMAEELPSELEELISAIS